MQPVSTEYLRAEVLTQGAATSTDASITSCLSQIILASPAREHVPAMPESLSC